MKEVYQSKLDKIIQDYEVLRKTFKWDNDLAKHLISLTFTMKDKLLNTNQIEEMKAYIKRETGVFSSFRGNMMFILAGLLSASSDIPQRDFDRILNNEKKMKEVGFKSGTYLPSALYTLISVCDDAQVEAHLKKAKDIYQDMKENHPFLTSGDDYALAILLASTNHNPQILEAYYTELSTQGFRKSNGLQMLSHILVFSQNETSETTKKCGRILKELKNNKLNVSSDYYAAIGVVTLLDIDENMLIADLIEIASYLKKIKHYKWLGKGMHILIASAIISCQYVNEQSEDILIDTTLNVSIQAIIAAQQAAMIAAIAASSAAAGAAN